MMKSLILGHSEAGWLEALCGLHLGLEISAVDKTRGPALQHVRQLFKEPNNDRVEPLG